MLFTYKALRKDNSSVSGTIEAADRDAAMTDLAHQGLHPLLVSEASARRGFGLNKKVKSSDMVIFTRQLSTMKVQIAHISARCSGKSPKT